MGMERQGSLVLINCFIKTGRGVVWGIPGLFGVGDWCRGMGVSLGYVDAVVYKKKGSLY